MAIDSSLNLYHLAMIIIFVLGYFAITVEHSIRVNKTSAALLMAIMCWVFQFLDRSVSYENNMNSLAEHLSNISQIVFFLLGALTIVEIINSHKGFQLISNNICVYSKKNLLWLVGIIAFFLSSVLDNLTTTIIMVTLLRKLTNELEDRLLMGGAVVIAANAGGAWTPIGDVTTTMLWIGGQVSTLAVMQNLFLPSLVCLIVGLWILSFRLKGTFDYEVQPSSNIEPQGIAVFWLGVASLIFVPIFKIMTGLPPFMGMIFGLGLMWLFTDLVHSRYQSREHLRVPSIITHIDVSGVLFFFGILLCIGALHTAGLLTTIAHWMDRTIGNSEVIAIAIGLVSAIVDNVPLVAAAMGMYEMSQYPKKFRNKRK